MNPNNRKPGTSGPARRKPSDPDYDDEDDADAWFDAEVVDASNEPHANAKSSSARRASEDDEDVGVAEEVLESDDDENGAKSKPGEEKGQSKSFFETLGSGLRNAGDTAKRYTHMGVTHAQLEKLKFDLRSAHAQLGEIAMGCWRDAPDLGLTAKDPAVIGVVKRVRQLRLKIREKQAKIAQLKKKGA